MELLRPTTEKKLSKWLVEYSHQLTTGHLGKQLLAPNFSGRGKAGETLVTNGSELMVVSYQVVLKKRPHVILSYFKNGKFEKDTIYLSSQRITFGVKVYFLCSCGRQCLKLFARKSSYGFACRYCQNLGYEAQGYNKRGTWSALSFFINRRQKLDAMKTGVKRISYRGKFTRRAMSVLKATKKWKLPALAGAMIGYNQDESQNVLAR